MNEEALRIFNLNLKEKVKGVWDENIPIVRHIVVECVGVNDEKLHDDNLEKNISELCEKLNLSVIKTFTHTFEPYGTSILVVLKESHFAIHSWPESGYCHIDIVTCTKDEQNLLEVANSVAAIFNSESIRIINLKY